MNLNRIVILASIAVVACPAMAVSPGSIELGRQLFEKEWTPGNPAITSDGLGPLFNATSCVACHHQGGVGGGGDSRFNAKTIGIESIKISGSPIRSDDVVKGLVSTFHPGFISSSGALSNSLPLSHHGGSSLFQNARSSMMSQIDSRFSSEGGPLEASEVRRAYATPILFHNQVGNRVITINARLFQRNTSPLFGLAAIDRIDGRDIEAQVRLQKKHPEISGRPSTLANGRYGKFGWRSNIASLLGFVDQACAAEVGLETKRLDQPADPMNRNYRNRSEDIADNQVRAMRDFIAALPAPTREVPEDSYERQLAVRGERVFASVGCAVCHVPDMGPAKGVYSDILLHDMGYESMDLNHAEPYIVRATPVSSFLSRSSVRTTGTGTMTSGYYGASSTVTVNVDSTSTSSTEYGGRGSQKNNRGRQRGLATGFAFTAPTGPSVRMRIVPVGTEDMTTVRESKTDSFGPALTGDFTVTNRTITTREDHVRVHFEDTKFNQEWRTPPLWGVRDSAPYMHDGRAETLLEAIVMHDGESAGTRDRFLQLSLVDREALISFLNTLVAPKNIPQFDVD